MATRRDDTEVEGTMAELVEKLGGVPLDRIRARPAPGTAKEEDVLAARRSPERRLCELVDETLVEKTYGLKGSVLGGYVAACLLGWARDARAGVAFGAALMYRLEPGLIRIPDASFVSWGRLGGELPDVEFLDVAPDLEVEVLTPRDAANEVRRKLREYFHAGARLVWVIDSEAERAEVYTSPTNRRRVAKNGTLRGGPVLPGFALPLAELFACTRRRRGQ